MPRSQFIASGYQIMWVIAMFDLPVKTALDRKTATQFRNMLLDEGFFMLQYSIYGRPCASEATAQVHRTAIRKALPVHGQVRILTITDRQFGKMENYVGLLPQKSEKNNEQLFLF